MAIRGDVARAVLRETIRQLGDLVPSEIELHIRGKRARTYFTARSGRHGIRTLQPGDDDYERIRRGLNIPDGEQIRMGGGRSHSGSFSKSYGAWIPFLPRKFAIKLAMIDVVETIQSAVSGAQGKPWPGEGFTVHAAQLETGVRLWFEDSDGTVIPAAMLDFNVAQPH